MQGRGCCGNRCHISAAQLPLGRCVLRRQKPQGVHARPIRERVGRLRRLAGTGRGRDSAQQQQKAAAAARLRTGTLAAHGRHKSVTAPRAITQGLHRRTQDIIKVAMFSEACRPHLDQFLEECQSGPVPSKSRGFLRALTYPRQRRV